MPTFTGKKASGSKKTSATQHKAPSKAVSRIVDAMAQQLAKHKVDAYYIPPEDEHLNEYLPEPKKRIEFLTGFAGEAAPVLVTPKQIYVYVDGRFHIQVDHEVTAPGITASKLGIAGQPKLSDTVKDLIQLHKGSKPFRLGYDPFIVSPNRKAALSKELSLLADKFEWVPVSGNLVDPLWNDVPDLPSTPVFSVSSKYTGKTVAQKLSQIRADMAVESATLLPITKLDEIAWLFNLRGADIPYNPVFESYALVTPKHAWLFSHAGKIPAKIAESLSNNGVTLKPYKDYVSVLQAELAKQSKMKSSGKIWLDNDGLTLGTVDIVKQTRGITWIEKPNPVVTLKAIKNTTELKYMQEANLKASRAIIRHLTWVDAQFKLGKKLSEAVVRDHLETMYKAEAHFHDLSFPTIPGIGTNSAIIHYSHADPKQVGKAGDFYLLDSGVHYTGGTTDTTRTTVLGKPTKQQKQRYTAVLKAHVQCAKLNFPPNTTGAQIDSVGRSIMWNQGIDFNHGTGHGVGAFLNVHEGPNRISTVCQVTFKPGMITSIEPGYYEGGWGGIRLENLAYVAPNSDLPSFNGRPWLNFKTLTYVPYEKKLIDTASLTPDELAWINAYYKEIWQLHHKMLDKAEKAWLADQLDLT